jgi:hypothetical protein
MDEQARFVRDKSYLLYLLREARVRLDEDDDWPSLKVGALLDEIAVLDLARRVGFKSTPLALDLDLLRHRREEDERQKEQAEKLGIYNTFGPRSMESAWAHERRIFNAYVWNDPHSGGGVGVESTERLGVILDRWIRAVEALEVLPPARLAGGVENGFDPLWRMLGYAVAELRKSDDRSWCLESWPRWIHSINRLAEYEGYPQPIFSIRVGAGGKQEALRLADPLSDSVTEFPFIDGGRLDDGEGERLLRGVESWRETRAQHVDEREVGTRVSTGTRQFLRAGPGWKVVFNGEEASFGDLQGMCYLAKLLYCPGRGIHVCELEGGQVPPTSEPAPLLDRDAREEYRLRLTELGSERDAAVESGDSIALGRVDEETASIGRSLKAATGPGGRERAFADEVEKARCRVKACLSAARKQIAEALPKLHEHLEASLREPAGLRPGYFPDEGEEEWMAR